MEYCFFPVDTRQSAAVLVLHAVHIARRDSGKGKVQADGIKILIEYEFIILSYKVKTGDFYHGRYPVQDRNR